MSGGNRHPLMLVFVNVPVQDIARHGVLGAQLFNRASLEKFETTEATPIGRGALSQVQSSINSVLDFGSSLC